jgi:glucose-6-phosphate 1-dehydrogenase
MERPQDCILTIFGASGDLTKRKLGPALFDLFCQELLPERFALVGVSRTPHSDESFRNLLVEGIKQHTYKKQASDDEFTAFAKQLYYQPIDTSAAEDYAKVKTRLKSLQDHLQMADNYIYYLSTPRASMRRFPSTSQPMAWSVRAKARDGNGSS